MSIISAIREMYGVGGDADTYKMSQPPQYPANTTRMVSYIESRGGKHDRVLFFGLQLLIKEYFLQKITHEQVDNLVRFTKLHFMENIAPEHEAAFRRVVDHYNGRLPIRIRAVREGTVLPVKNVLVVVESTVDDSVVAPLVSYFETKLMRVWSPTTVATESYHIRQAIYEALKITSDNPDAEILWKLHDFGSRGTTSMESSAFSAAGHLVAFRGSDTSVAVMAANLAYSCEMAGFSIPASEHSTTTAHGRYGEAELVKRMFDSYAKPGALFATVIDSYNWKEFITKVAPQFRKRLHDSGATWVFRPDSGDPVLTPIQVIRELGKVFGYTVNSKGYRVLNNVRVIQGDGIDSEDVSAILDRLVNDPEKWSVSNIAFGMGGGLLQRNNRDTQKFAMKLCAINRDGEWFDVFKSPAVFNTETWEVEPSSVVSFKQSKAGRQELMYNTQTGAYKTVRYEDFIQEVGKYGWESALHTVYENGELMLEWTMDQVREQAGTM